MQYFVLICTYNSLFYAQQSHHYTVILVIVDQASKQAIFTPTYDTITSEQLTKLFVTHVFSKHGVLNHVTSD